ncbi:MAG: hypothetical protein M3R58_14570 [Pseudomonadota bacterium]|nr:hypothetical protein [Pseudomonadota bacterium]
MAIVAAGCAFALSACMTMTPANYMVSQEAKGALAKYSGSKVAVAQIAGPASFEPMCRAVGNIAIPEGSIGQFVAKGFNDELKYAGMYADGGVKLTGTVTRAAFSTSAAIVNGWWEIALSLQSSNGQSMAVETRYDFEAGFVGPGACNNASRALGPAVQQLVYKTITDPRFAALIR